MPDLLIVAEALELVLRGGVRVEGQVKLPNLLMVDKLQHPEGLTELEQFKHLLLHCFDMI